MMTIDDVVPCPMSYILHLDNSLNQKETIEELLYVVHCHCVDDFVLPTMLTLLIPVVHCQTLLMILMKKEQFVKELQQHRCKIRIIVRSLCFSFDFVCLFLVFFILDFNLNCIYLFYLFFVIVVCCYYYCVMPENLLHALKIKRRKIKNTV